MPHAAPQLPHSKRFPRGPRRLVRAALAVVFVLMGAQLSAAPTVAVSIKPLQLLAAAITDGVSEPVLALAPGQDPHHLSLRPSERRTLAQADLILWVGPQLELALVGVIDSVPAEVITAQQLDGLVLLKSSGNHADPHVWLDTRNARLIAAALAERLAVLDADNAAQYHSNLQHFAASLDRLDADNQGRLAGLESQQWAVYHHAFRYFEQQFALQPPLTLADDHNNAPGVRTVLALQQQLQQGDIHCLLTEPDVNHAELRNMLAPASPELRVADVMGLDLSPAADSYAQLLQALGQQVARCLRGSDE